MSRETTATMEAPQESLFPSQQWQYQVVLVESNPQRAIAQMAVRGWRYKDSFAGMDEGGILPRGVCFLFEKPVRVMELADVPAPLAT